MTNKYEKNFLDLASKLDAISDSCGEITKVAYDFVQTKDNQFVRKITVRISLIATSDSFPKDVKRLASSLKESLVEYCGYLYVISACNESNVHGAGSVKTLDDLLGELNSLTGLQNVKQQVNSLIAYQSVKKKRQEIGIGSKQNTLHMAFIGNPGTGKTTVARIVGLIYKQIGLLSKGHFIEVSRTDLIAGYQGQTALKVREVIDKAKGGVLFIDEAYSITENEHSDSYGRECLTELTKALEDFRDDLVVIVAGYTEPMHLFFKSNPGLKSRFNIFIEFGDFSADELIEILFSISENNNYKIEDELRERLREYFLEERSKPDGYYANGRLARNIFDDLVMNHAKRVDLIKSPSYIELSVLRLEDFDYRN